VNPFIFDRPLAPEDLIDREPEAAALLDRAVGSTNSRLTSPRRFGKTSLLQRVLRDADLEGFSTVYVDLYGITTLGRLARTLETAYEQRLKGAMARAFTGLRRAAVARGKLGAGPIGAEVELLPAADQERILLEILDLPRRLHERTGVRTVVAFDEFQVVLDVGQRMDALIRSVIQHHGPAANYIFAGSHPGLMSALFAERERPLYAQAAPLRLGRLDDGDLAEYVAERFERSGRDATPALGSVIDAAGGHPQRAMLLAHLLWEETEPGGVAGDETFTAAWEAAGRWLAEDFEQAWARWTLVERRLVTATASARDGLYARATLQRFELSKASAQKAARRLIEAGELERDEHSPTGHRLIDPLLERWVAAGARWPS
jgi:uncharacterized protein